MLQVCQCVEAARTHRDVVALYEDEFTFYQHPTVANGWGLRGKTQPLAKLSHTGENKRRIAGALNAIDGSVLFVHDTKIGVKELGEFYRQVRRQYQTAETIYLIMDNWPVHNHPDLLEVAEQNKLQLIPLPTYAPWTNPIEKLWRWLYQNILHLHHHSEDWDLLVRMVCNFLRQFSQGSENLLRYVGLTDGNIPACPPNWKEAVNYKENAPPHENETHSEDFHKVVLPI